MKKRVVVQTAIISTAAIICPCAITSPYRLIATTDRPLTPPYHAGVAWHGSVLASGLFNTSADLGRDGAPTSGAYSGSPSSSSSAWSVLPSTRILSRASSRTSAPRSPGCRLNLPIGPAQIVRPGKERLTRGSIRLRGTLAQEANIAPRAVSKKRRVHGRRALELLIFNRFSPLKRSKRLGQLALEGQNVTEPSIGSYFASYNGERIAEYREPLCAGARWLLAHGHATPNDTIVMCRDGKPAMSGNIAKLAKLTVSTAAPYFIQWDGGSDDLTQRPISEQRPSRHSPRDALRSPLAAKPAQTLRLTNVRPQSRPRPLPM